MDYKSTTKKTSLTKTLSITTILFILTFFICLRVFVVIGEEEGAQKALRYLGSSSYQYGVHRTGETLYRLICSGQISDSCSVKVLDKNGNLLDSFPKSEISLSAYLGWTSDSLTLPGFAGEYRIVVSSTPSASSLMKWVGFSFSISLAISVFAFLGMYAKQQARLKSQIFLYETELKSLYAKEEFSRLALKVAHDIRSPLGALKTLVYTATDMPEEKRNFLTMASKRIEDIADDLLVQSRRDNRPQKIELMPLIDELISEKKLESAGNPHLNIRVVGPNSTTVNIIEKDFKRLLSNILNNARDALANSIEISISVKDSVRIKVRDDGVGIEPTTLKKLFNEKITTKEFGNGLGLLDSKSMLNSWGGDICLESCQGKGTLVTISLPT
ncbi:MAG: HAMP domain-containing histidine kinase [Bdellovibrionales bacterium]|nr:HAMP domain-containing histidine kinase [Bdellovibrionales bacterium]